MRRFFEEGLGGGDLDLTDALVAADAVMHNPLILDAPGSCWGTADRFDFLQQLGIIGSDDELGANR